MYKTDNFITMCYFVNRYWFKWGIMKFQTKNMKCFKLNYRHLPFLKDHIKLWGHCTIFYYQEENV